MIWIRLVLMVYIFSALFRETPVSPASRERLDPKESW